MALGARLRRSSRTLGARARLVGRNVSWNGSSEVVPRRFDSSPELEVKKRWSARSVHSAETRKVNLIMYGPQIQALLGNWVDLVGRGGRMGPRRRFRQQQWDQGQGDQGDQCGPY